MKKILQSLLIFSALFASIADAAQQFSDFYFFGDSLSDIGNDTAYAPDTNPPGTLWAQVLAARYGKSVRTSTNGGNDYAVWNSRSYDYTDSYDVNRPGINTQVQRYLAKGAIDNRALYSIWIGANDLNRLSLIDMEANLALIDNGTNNIVGAVARLSAAGARYIIVPNIPDISKTPKFKGFGPFITTRVSQAVSLFNASLSGKLSTGGYNVIQLDVFTTFNAIMDNPQKYGFTNVTDQCVVDGCDADRASKYLFYDTVHPTTAGGQLIADYAASIFQGAMFTAIMADMPLAVMNSTNVAIANELAAIRNNSADMPLGRYRAFFNGNYQPGSHSPEDALPDYKSTGLGGLVGVDYRLTEDVMVGAALSRTIGDVSLGGNGGGFSINENMLSLFTGYAANRAYINGTANLGLVDYRSINRNVILYKSRDVATAATTALHYGVQLEAGYNLFDSAFKSGPFASVNYQNINVKSYAESNATPGTNLVYYDQVNRSLITGLGWQFAYSSRWYHRSVMPFAQLSVNREWLRRGNSYNGMREVEVGLLSIPNNRSRIPVGASNNQVYGLLNFGVNSRLTNQLFASLSVQATLWQRSYKNYVLLCGLQMPF